MPPKHHQHVFIRLPGSERLGLRDRYYQVDPDTLTLSILTELYRRGERSGALERAYGVTPDIALANPADLLRQWRDIRGQVTDLLPDSDVASEFARELVAAVNSLPRLIEALTNGQLTDAGGALGALGENLTTLALAITETAAQLVARAAEPDEQAGDSAADVREELYLTTVESLADSFDEGLSAYNELQTLEAELDALIKALEQTQNWATHIAAGPDWLSEQLAWLGEDDGFSRVASHFLIRRDPSLVGYMVAVIGGDGGVRDRLQAIATLIDEARAKHRALRDRADAALEQQFRIDTLIRAMQEAREEVDKLTRTGIDPFRLVGGLITEAEFRTWQGLSADPNWQSLLAASHRLRDKIQLMHQLVVQEPALAPADARVVSTVENYVGLIEAMLVELGQPTRQDPVPTPRITAEAAPRQTRKQSALPPGVDPARLEVLYELMLAIGAVKYCDWHNLTGGTPKAMFDLLEALGLMTHDERALYSAKLRQRLMTESLEVESSGLTRKQAWDQTDPRDFLWIRFKATQGRGDREYNRWRLVKMYYQAALALCAKYGVSPEAIEQAYEARKAANAARYRD